MLKRLSHPLVTCLVSSIIFMTGSQAVYAEKLAVLGNLEAKGAITVLVPTDGVKASVRLNDTTYAYVSGDRIQTGGGTGVLKIENTGRIGFAPRTVASVTGNDHTITVDLEAGSLAYTLTPAADVRIHAGDMVLQPLHSAIRRVSDDAIDQVVGWVSINKDGKLNVGSHSGQVEVRQGGNLRVVKAGEQSVIEVNEGQLIVTQAEGAGPVDDDGNGNGDSHGWQILGILAVIGGAIVGVAMGEGDDGGNQLASP